MDRSRIEQLATLHGFAYNERLVAFANDCATTARKEALAYPFMSERTEAKIEKIKDNGYRVTGLVLTCLERKAHRAIAEQEHVRWMPDEEFQRMMGREQQNS